MADDGKQDQDKVTFDDLEKVLLLLQGDQDLSNQEVREGLLFLLGISLANRQLITSLYTWLGRPDIRRQTVLEDAAEGFQATLDLMTQKGLPQPFLEAYQQQLQGFRDLYNLLDPPESKA